MTAISGGILVDTRNTDAELVHGHVAGDESAFAQIYDRYADRLYDFCVRMLRDRDGAADCVQEAFCVAAIRLPQLRDPEKLRPWLYSIARNEALAWLRERRRETPSDQLPDIESDDPTPDSVATRTELAELIAKAAGGLSDRDRVVFDLAYQHGLSGPELADALEISHTNANKIVLRLRRTIERSLGALLLSRRAGHAGGGCAELGEILAGWDGQLTVLMRKRISRHVESCPPCDDEQRRLVNPAALLGATPILIPAPDWLRERTLTEVQLTCHGSPMQGEIDGAGALSAAAVEDLADSDDDADARRRDRRWLLAAALLIAVLGASARLTFLLDGEPIATIPIESSRTAPEPNGQVPTPSDLPSSPLSLPTPTIDPTPLPPPRAPVNHIPNPLPPPRAPVVQPPAIATLTPQGPVEQSLEPVTAPKNASLPASRSPVFKQTPGSERKLDARRFPAAPRDRDSTVGSSTSLQRSSSPGDQSSAAPRAAMRPAPAADADPEPNSPAPRRAARGTGAPDADPPARGGTGR